MNFLEKNVLDLEHNLLLSKAVTCVALAMGIVPTIFLVLFQLQGASLMAALFICLVLGGMFLHAGLQQFARCALIRSKILQLGKK